MDQALRGHLASDGNAADWFVDRHVREGGADRVAFVDPGAHA